LRELVETLMFTGMSNDRPEIELNERQYRERRGFDGPLASRKHLLLSLVVSLLVAGAAALLAAWQRDLWWLVLAPIPIAMNAGAALAGLWPNFFFGTDPTKDD
jgi:hypothetical protein